MRMLVLALVLLLVPAARAQTSATPWIGIGLGPGTEGVGITALIENAPGQRAGLLPGDQVLAIDGAPVKVGQELVERVAEKGVGQTVTLTVLRAGKRFEVKLALEARPDQLQLLRDHLVGKKAPAFALEGKGPHPARLDALSGKVVVLEFWATWCGPCNSTLPRLSEWQRRYGKRGLRVVGVSTEPLPVLTKHIGRRELGYTLATDPEGAMSDRFQVPAVPTFVVIDAGGIVRHVDVGAGSRVDAVEAAFLPLLGK